MVWPPAGCCVDSRTGRIVLDHSVEDRLYALFHLIAYRGLRRGEAIGLPWLETDLPGRRLRIMQQVVQIGWDVAIGRPKTDGGERHVTLDEPTAVALERWSQLQAAERDACGSGWRRTGLVFTDVSGGAPHPDFVSTTFQRLAAAAGLPPIRLHDLRHAAASLAPQAGVPLKVVSQELGHSSLAITADTYTSVLPAVAAAAAEAVTGIVPRGPGPRPKPLGAPAVGGRRRRRAAP